MRLFLVFFSVLIFSSAANALSLSDPVTGIGFTIDPSTLAAEVQLAQGRRINVSSSVSAGKVSELIQTNLRMQWQRDDVQIEMFLEGDVCVLRFTRKTPGEISWPQIPSGAIALILPLFEGSYIPTMDAQWRQVLQEHYQAKDTTQDLSLPTIGFDEGESVLSIVYANPFNNQIIFKPDEQGIAVSSKHIFTRLDTNRTYEVRISINANDLLAPAKRYRAWLQQQGQFVALKDKLAAATDGQRLIGASHVYLWGERMLTPRDVKDWSLLQRLTPSLWLNQTAIGAVFTSDDIRHNKYNQQLLIQIINEHIEQQMPGYTADIFNQRREWIVHVLGSALNPVATWGDVSPALIAQLQQSGLEKLWIGLPAWAAGFANPTAIKTARAAGYLIGPYDSYDTALPEANSNPSWLSAQLGQEAFLTCGVLQENGQRTAGFQHQGVYTNPVCVRPLLQKRVTKLQQELAFNSWFIDVDATGMLFDDYDSSRLTSQAQDAKNRVDSMAWIAKQFKLVVGSEDGHAVANSSIAFAHGMQVRGFGWRDKDMRNNESSPFYLGRWFPDYQPELFFKRTSIKPEYRRLYFNPAYRLPLFQAAFHDSLVTTNHWSLDNLKFTETQEFTELLQQLYNVPPLVNISMDTAPKRLIYLKHIDAFFRPMHARLYNQTLTDFNFLTKDGLLQQTRFADGTTLIANFNEVAAAQWNGNNIAPRSLVAYLPDGKLINFTTKYQ